MIGTYDKALARGVSRGGPMKGCGKAVVLKSIRNDDKERDIDININAYFDQGIVQTRK